MPAKPEIEASWYKVLKAEFEAPYFKALKSFLQEEMKHHASKKMPFITNKNSVNDADLIRAFRERVEVKNRMYRLKKYKKCFVGSEAVDVLAELTGKSRKEALLIGINLGVNLFEHVTDPSTHPVLEDSYIFFRFLKWTEFSSGGRRQL